MRHALVIALVGGLAAVAAYVGYVGFRQGPQSIPGQRHQSRHGPPPLSDTPFVNATSARATYVGAQTCRECHAGKSDSYRRTAHSRALSEVDPDEEPPSGTFQHPASGRSYRVYRRDGELRHREWMAGPDEETVIESDFAVRYLIGSGRHTRSYLVDDDGFLVESPITWYASRDEWAMSPGYDRPLHWGFERAADVGCLVCHTGRVEPVGGSPQRVELHEKAIGCERCHGPGSLHAERHRGLTESSRTDSGPDHTIVHPGRLSRRLIESICADCHLRGTATVAVWGRSPAEFRPGLPLTDFRIDYRLKRADSRMKVVGHVEQMRLSACYRASETLTCTTCHDLHRAQPIRDPDLFYKKTCLGCHEPAHCGLPETTRRKRSAEDDCLSCHMPQTETDIPHIAFTHHRIGIHDTDSVPPRPGAAGQLVPMQDVSQLPAVERERCLGLAYLELSRKTAGRRAAGAYRRRARDLLEKVQARGRDDPAVDAALAQLYWERSPGQAIERAQSALSAEGLSGRARVSALFVLGDCYWRTGRPTRAAEPLEQLVRLRRHSEDWLLLGLTRARLGQRDAALEALRRAAEINPFRPEIHQAMAGLYEEMEAQDQTVIHRRKARLLRAFLRESATRSRASSR